MAGREQKITLGEMLSPGPTRLIVYCADYKCTHRVTIDANQWANSVRLSDLEPKFTCQAAGSAAPMCDLYLARLG